MQNSELEVYGILGGGQSVTPPFSGGALFTGSAILLIGSDPGLAAIYKVRLVVISTSGLRYLSTEDTQKHMKRCPMSFVIKKMQIKTTTRYHITVTRMAITKQNRNPENNKCC